MQTNPNLEKTIIRKIGPSKLKPVEVKTPSILSNQFLNKLVHTVGHDLRSPMFVIRSYSQLLQRTQEKERLERGFKLISEATVTMENTINALVQLMDIYTLPAQPTTLLSFEEILEQAKLQLYNELQEFKPKINVDFQAFPKVKFSSLYLKEIMVQLIDNAMRHNKEKQNLTIKISSQKIGERLVLQIEDNGKGVETDAEKEILKDPLYSNSSDTQCSGIGLSKVQAIAQVCRGNFEIESQAGEGVICQFYFR